MSESDVNLTMVKRIVWDAGACRTGHILEKGEDA